MGDCKNCENSSSDSDSGKDHHDCGGISSAQISSYAGDIGYLRPK